MPITTLKYEEKQLTIHIATDHIFFMDVLATLEKTYKENPTLHSIWDLSKAADIGIRKQEIDLLSGYLGKFIHMRDGGKTALILNGSSSSKILNMIEDRFKDQPVSVKIFKSPKPAMRWLNVDWVIEKEQD